jgi:hypothetical protein
MNKEKEILDLFFLGDNNNFHFIASIVDRSEMFVSQVVKNHYKTRIKYKKENLIILNSKINYDAPL